jgi:DNA-binding response OmpR family regulator
LATVLLALGDSSLQQACLAQLEAAGHAPVLLPRPLAALTLARRVSWDAACVDGSETGRAALRLLPASSAAPVLGLGVEDAALRASIELPVAAERLLSALEEMLAGADAGLRAGALRLDRGRRLALSAGREVALTRTEFRLLEVLFERQPGEVSLIDVLSSVWGYTEGRGTSELVRAHVRNLRAKLAEIGLPDAVRSRRGRGYALAV